MSRPMYYEDRPDTPIRAARGPERSAREVKRGVLGEERASRPTEKRSEGGERSQDEAETRGDAGNPRKRPDAAVEALHTGRARLEPLERGAKQEERDEPEEAQRECEARHG